eukprot:TRINITY_DN3773_c0_g1_i6.p1 TRINITY_DN3773_c0_g1~~TRINITY_DN3773_c0_g1_i6.p1  ORF type:complete len:405 (-),score=65.36 TRINITY_DN3773_c0_g1_i6:149-1363(-)
MNQIDMKNCFAFTIFNDDKIEEISVEIENCLKSFDEISKEVKRIITEMHNANKAQNIRDIDESVIIQIIFSQQNQLRQSILQIHSPNHQQDLQIPMEILKDKYYNYLTSSYHSNYFEKESFQSLLSRQKQEMSELQKLHVRQIERYQKKIASQKLKRVSTVTGALFTPESSNDYLLEQKTQAGPQQQKCNNCFQQSTPPHYQQLNFSDWIFPANCFSNCDYSLEHSLDLFEDFVHQESRLMHPNYANQQIIEECQEQIKNDDVSFSQKQNNFQELFSNEIFQGGTIEKTCNKEEYFQFLPGINQEIQKINIMSPQFTPMDQPKIDQLNLMAKNDYYDISLNDSLHTKTHTEAQVDFTQKHKSDNYQNQTILSFNKECMTSNPEIKNDNETVVKNLENSFSHWFL